MNSEDRVSAVKGIGAKTESHLARIGIYTVGDFIEHYPREYHTYDVPISIDNTEFDNCRQYGYSVVLSEIPKLLKRGRTAIVSVMLHEGTASGYLYRRTICAASEKPSAGLWSDRGGDTEFFYQDDASDP